VSSPERPLVLVLRFVEEVLHGRDISALDDLLSSDHVDHSGMPLAIPGAAGVRERLEPFFDSFSDVRVGIEDLVAQGDTVAWRWLIRARHTSTFLGLEPTDREIQIAGISFERISSDRIVESWSRSNALEVLLDLRS
jgi:predicted ester cyclase